MAEESSRSADGDGVDLDEVRRHLDPVVDQLSAKFSDTDREHVAEVVESVAADLSADARIPDHLAALTQHHAQEQLKSEHG